MAQGVKEPDAFRTARVYHFISEICECDSSLSEYGDDFLEKMTY